MDKIHSSLNRVGLTTNHTIGDAINKIAGVAKGGSRRRLSRSRRSRHRRSGRRHRRR